MGENDIARWIYATMNDPSTLAGTSTRTGALALFRDGRIVTSIPTAPTTEPPSNPPAIPIEVLGLFDWDEFDALTDRLTDAVSRSEPLTDVDWARALFLTEITWASCLVGAGLDFEIVTGSPTPRPSRCCVRRYARSALGAAPNCCFRAGAGPPTLTR